MKNLDQRLRDHNRIYRDFNLAYAINLGGYVVLWVLELVVVITHKIAPDVYMAACLVTLFSVYVNSHFLRKWVVKTTLERKKYWDSRE